MSDQFEPRLIGFLCRWCSYNGADLAGTSRMKYPPNLVPIKTNCSGRVDPTHIMKALSEGADGVLIAGCHIGDCHYINGNWRTVGRYPMMKKMLEQLGLEPGRVRLEWVSAAEGEKFQRVVTEFTEEIRALGPLGWGTQFAMSPAPTAPAPVRRARQGGGARMSEQVQVRHVLGGQLRRLRDRPARDRRQDPRRRRGLRRRLLARRRRLQVQGPRGLRRRLHRRLPLQRLHPQLRERAHRQAAAPEVEGRWSPSAPAPSAAASRVSPTSPTAAEIKRARLHAEPLARQPRRHDAAGEARGPRGRARAAAPLRHRQDARPDGRRRLLRARLRARAAPDLERARRRHRRPQGRGRAAAQGRHDRRQPQDLLRRVQAREGREEDQRLQAHLGVPARPREVPARAGRRLHGRRHARRLRRALHQHRHAVSRLLRRRPTASSTRAPRCSARWPRSSRPTRPTRSPRSRPRCPTRSARSTASGLPARCSGGRGSK